MSGIMIFTVPCKIHRNSSYKSFSAFLFCRHILAYFQPYLFYSMGKKCLSLYLTFMLTLYKFGSGAQLLQHPKADWNTQHTVEPVLNTQQPCILMSLEYKWRKFHHLTFLFILTCKCPKPESEFTISLLLCYYSRPPWFKLFSWSRASTQGVRFRSTSHRKQI